MVSYFKDLLYRSEPADIKIHGIDVNVIIVTVLFFRHLLVSGDSAIHRNFGIHVRLSMADTFIPEDTPTILEWIVLTAFPHVRSFALERESRAALCEFQNDLGTRQAVSDFLKDAKTDVILATLDGGAYSHHTSIVKASVESGVVTFKILGSKAISGSAGSHSLTRAFFEVIVDEVERVNGAPLSEAKKKQALRYAEKFKISYFGSDTKRNEDKKNIKDAFTPRQCGVGLGGGGEGCGGGSSQDILDTMVRISGTDALLSDRFPEGTTVKFPLRRFIDAVIEHINPQVDALKQLLSTVRSHKLISDKQIINIVHRSGGGCGHPESLIFTLTKFSLMSAGLVGGEAEDYAKASTTKFLTSSSLGDNVTTGLAILTAESLKLPAYNRNDEGMRSIQSFTLADSLLADCDVVLQGGQTHNLLKAGSVVGKSSKDGQKLRVEYDPWSEQGLQIFLIWYVVSATSKRREISSFSFADLPWPARKNGTLTATFTGANRVRVSLVSTQGRSSNVEITFMDEGGGRGIRTLDRIFVRWLKARSFKKTEAIMANIVELHAVSEVVLPILTKGDAATQADLITAIGKLSASTIPRASASNLDVAVADAIPRTYIPVGGCRMDTAGHQDQEGGGGGGGGMDAPGHPVQEGQEDQEGQESEGEGGGDAAGHQGEEDDEISRSNRKRKSTQ